MAKHIKTDGTITDVYPLNGKSFSLEELQKFVGGNIEIVSVKNSNDLVMFINEEGKLNPHYKNIIATKIALIDEEDYIAGDAIVCNHFESGDEEEEEIPYEN